MVTSQYSDPNEEKKSEATPFNMAVASLQRLHIHRYKAGEARYCNPVDINMWLRSLENQFSEIIAMKKIKLEEKQGYEQIRLQYYDILEEHIKEPMCRKKGGGFCPHFSKLQWKLDELDRYISELIETYNLAMPEKGNFLAHMGEGF